MASVIKVDTILNTDGSTKTFGKVLQVKSVTSSPTRYTISSAELVNIPDLSISFTRQSSTSHLLLMAMINNNAVHVTSYGFAVNGTAIGGTGNTNVSSGALSTMYWGSSSTNYMENTHLSYMYTSPPTSGTYTARAAASWNGSNYTLYINDRASNDMRSVSTFTIMEIEP